jgi:Uma2 family endonuclease
MRDRLTVGEYFSGAEALTRRDMVWGVLRDAPAPDAQHQSVLIEAVLLLTAHVRERDLGAVLVAPVDVVLDGPRALVVQPDLLFIARERLDLVGRQVWGAPDLVVEVASPGTYRFDRTVRLDWYEDYGVRECWLLDPPARAVTVVGLAGGRRERRYADDEPVGSSVLPEFAAPARAFFP